MDKCENCRYGDPNIYGKDGYLDLYEDLICRKNPPSKNSYWPTVGKNDWCGEFQNKIDIGIKKLSRKNKTIDVTEIDSGKSEI